MRQAGILAAAGLIALEEMPAKLADDHANAKFMAEGLATTPRIRVERQPQTNILFFDVTETGYSGTGFSGKLKERGVLMNAASGAARLRLLTHFDVNRADCIRALEVVRALATGN
jgi:threonine aldolase